MRASRVSFTASSRRMAPTRGRGAKRVTSTTTGVGAVRGVISSSGPSSSVVRRVNADRRIAPAGCPSRGKKYWFPHVTLECRVHSNPGDGVLHFVNQGLHILDVTGIPHGQRQGKDEAGRWLGDNPGLAAELGGAMAFAFANGRNRGIVGVYDFAVAQRLALRQPTGWGGDPLMGLERGREPRGPGAPAGPPTAAAYGASALAGPAPGAGLDLHAPTVAS